MMLSAGQLTRSGRVTPTRSSTLFKAREPRVVVSELRVVVTSARAIFNGIHAGGDEPVFPNRGEPSSGLSSASGFSPATASSLARSLASPVPVELGSRLRDSSSSTGTIQSESDIKQQLRQLKAERFRLRVKQHAFGSVSIDPSFDIGTSADPMHVLDQNRSKYGEEKPSELQLAVANNSKSGSGTHSYARFEHSGGGMLKWIAAAVCAVVSVKAFRVHKESKRCLENVPLFRNYCLKKLNRSPMALATLSWNHVILDGEVVGGSRSSDALLQTDDSDADSKEEEEASDGRLAKTHLKKKKSAKRRGSKKKENIGGTIVLHRERIDYSWEYESNVVGVPLKDTYQVMFHVKNEATLPPTFGIVYAQFERVMPSKAIRTPESSQTSATGNDVIAVGTAEKTPALPKTKEESGSGLLSTISKKVLSLKVSDSETVRKYKAYIYVQVGLDPDLHAPMATIQEGELVQLGFLT